jgi:hypothetical protein
MKKLFFCLGVWAALNEDGGLVGLTEIQAELAVKTTRDLTLVAFQEGTEQPPLFVSQSDTRVKRVNIFDVEAFRGVCKVELSDCREPVLSWIASNLKNGQSWLTVVKRDLASRIL